MCSAALTCVTVRKVSAACRSRSFLGSISALGGLFDYSFDPRFHDQIGYTDFIQQFMVDRCVRPRRFIVKPSLIESVVAAY